MVFAHINKIQHGPTRKATKIALRAHLILLKLIALKTILFSFVGVKAFVMESAFLMAIMGWIPHVQTTFAQVLPSVNYSISNTTFPLITEDGEVVIYMYYMQNDQQPYTPGSNVEVSANIPEGMSYDGASIEPSSITETTVTWTIPDNDNRYKMILLRLMVEPETKGSVTNTVTVTAANPDPNTSNNSASASVVVGNDGNLQGDVDLYLTKTVDMTQANITDEITYTIDFGNMGADTAIGTIIYDLIPDDIYIISADPLPTHINNNGIYQRTIGDLPGGQG